MCRYIQVFKSEKKIIYIPSILTFSEINCSLIRYGQDDLISVHDCAYFSEYMYIFCVRMIKL